MAKQNHRLGGDESHLVKRRFKVVEPNEEAMEKALTEIDAIYGMEEARFSKKTQELHVAYDASRICLDSVEDILRDHRVEIEKGWWNSFKGEYYRYVDQNIKDNARHEPFSCHKVPPHK